MAQLIQTHWVSLTLLHTRDEMSQRLRDGHHNETTTFSTALTRDKRVWSQSQTTTNTTQTQNTVPIINVAALEPLLLLHSPLTAAVYWRRLKTDMRAAFSGIAFS